MEAEGKESNFSPMKLREKVPVVWFSQSFFFFETFEVIYSITSVYIVT